MTPAGLSAASRSQLSKLLRHGKIETQNLNAAACRFYMTKGARLGGFDRFADKDLPDEVELDWYLAL